MDQIHSHDPIIPSKRSQSAPPIAPIQLAPFESIHNKFRPKTSNSENSESIAEEYANKHSTSNATTHRSSSFDDHDWLVTRMEDDQLNTVKNRDQKSNNEKPWTAYKPRLSPPPTSKMFEEPYPTKIKRYFFFPQPMSPNAFMKHYDVQLEKERLEADAELDYMSNYLRMYYCEFLETPLETPVLERKKKGSTELDIMILISWLRDVRPRTRADAYPLLLLAKDVIKKLLSKELRIGEDVLTKVTQERNELDQQIQAISESYRQSLDTVQKKSDANTKITALQAQKALFDQNEKVRQQDEFRKLHGRMQQAEAVMTEQRQKIIDLQKEVAEYRLSWAEQDIMKNMKSPSKANLTSPTATAAAAKKEIDMSDIQQLPIQRRALICNCLLEDPDVSRQINMELFCSSLDSDQVISLMRILQGQAIAIGKDTLDVIAEIQSKSKEELLGELLDEAPAHMTSKFMTPTKRKSKWDTLRGAILQSSRERKIGTAWKTLVQVIHDARGTTEFEELREQLNADRPPEEIAMKTLGLQEKWREEEERLKKFQTEKRIDVGCQTDLLRTTSASKSKPVPGHQQIQLLLQQQSQHQQQQQQAEKAALNELMGLPHTHLLMEAPGFWQQQQQVSNKNWSAVVLSQWISGIYQARMMKISEPTSSSCFADFVMECLVQSFRDYGIATRKLSEICIAVRSYSAQNPRIRVFSHLLGISERKGLWRIHVTTFFFRCLQTILPAKDVKNKLDDNPYMPLERLETATKYIFSGRFNLDRASDVVQLIHALPTKQSTKLGKANRKDEICVDDWLELIFEQFLFQLNGGIRLLQDYIVEQGHQSLSDALQFMAFLKKLDPFISENQSLQLFMQCLRYSQEKDKISIDALIQVILEAPGLVRIAGSSAEERDDRANFVFSAAQRNTLIANKGRRGSLVLSSPKK